MDSERWEENGSPHLEQTPKAQLSRKRALFKTASVSVTCVVSEVSRTMFKWPPLAALPSRFCLMTVC